MGTPMEHGEEENSVLQEQEEEFLEQSSLPEPLLSESLVGLVGAFDRLKQTMGYTGESNSEEDENMLEIQRYVNRIREENETLRQHAEDAIMMAQKYKDAYDELSEENTGLYDQLTQSKMSDMMSHTKELTTVAYEYDREVIMTKVAQAEEMMAHAYEMQQRVDELEEENEALKQTLHEIREDQKQMYSLRQMDTAIPMPSFESPLIGDGNSPPRESLSGKIEAMGDTDDGNSTAPGTETTTPAPEPAVSGESSHYATPHNSTRKDDPVAIADALAAVAAGSETGMAASASKMLRGYHALKAELEEVKSRNETLAKENEELSDMMTSKQFKAPSAWAEREVKYKLEKKEWEEALRAKEAEVKHLEAANETLRSAKGTDELNQKIEDLEAQIVVLRRECDQSQAALHDMQVSSLVSAGEFSASGVKPFDKHDDVHSMVDKIESEAESRDASSQAAPIESHAHAQEIEHQLETVQKEKDEILHQIEEHNTSELLFVKKAEIALLENGMELETASKILALETSTTTAANTAESEEILLQFQKVLSSENLTEEDTETLQALQIATHPTIEKPVFEQNHEGDSTSTDKATSSPSLPKEVEERIDALKKDVEEIQSTSKKTAPTTSSSPVVGMQPRAAAALAAMHRAQGHDIKQLKQQLEEASKREQDLKQSLDALKLSSPSINTQKLEADKAWEDHQKKSDMNSILRQKAEIETKFEMTKTQLAKSQQALDAAMGEKTALRRLVQQAISSGDVADLKKALEESQSSSKKKKTATSPLKKLRGRGLFSRKSNSRPGSAQDDDNIPTTENLRRQSSSQNEGEFIMIHHDETPSQLEKHVQSLSEENNMLMDQLVTAKVRLAEVEGDCLQSRRALVRAKEKQMELARQLHDQRTRSLS